MQRGCASLSVIEPPPGLACTRGQPGGGANLARPRYSSIGPTGSANLARPRPAGVEHALPTGSGRVAAFLLSTAVPELCLGIMAVSGWDRL